MKLSEDLKIMLKFISPLAALGAVAIYYKHEVDSQKVEIGDLKAQNIKVTSDLNRRIDELNSKLERMYELQTNIEVIKSKMQSYENVIPFKYKVVPQ